jgi:4-amino-4-deoxy-L-arabinose transferase-like glycosyltransferase
MAKNKIISWLKQHRFEFIVLTLIILISLFTRLYRIDEYLTFLGDEGRDVRIVRDLLRGNLVFIGPQTSIGNMYLGPLYYYLIAPSLWFANLNPVGPAIMNALIGTVTVFLTWFFARRLFNQTTALIAAFLFALSPVAIIYSRSSWNPNPMPLFALLSIWGIYQVWQLKKDKYLFLVAISLAFALQMHYLGLLLIPALGLFWLISFFESKKDPQRKNKFVKLSLLSLFTFFLLMSPLLLFDLKHNFMNFNAFKQFFSNRQTTININPANSDRFLPVIFQIVEDLLLSRQKILLPLISLLTFVFSVLAYFSLDRKGKSSAKILFVWLIFAVLGLGIYKQHVYAHYFGFIYPAIYLLAGLIISSLFLTRHLLGKVSACLILIGLTVLSIKYSPLQESPHRQLQRTETIVNSIIKESNQQPFNFGLIAKQNYDESYRYFLENQHANLIRGEKAITDQLFVVCEDGDLCQPLGNPAWQIAVFGQAKIEKEWQIDGIKLYQLVHQN